MSNFSTWLLAFFMVMFWIFRCIVALCTQFSIDFLGMYAYNFNWEVVIAFLTLLSIVLVVKRNIVGSLLYLTLYGVYFGEHFITNILPLVQGQANLDVGFAANLIVDIIAIGLAFFVLLDTLVDKSRKINPMDGKTDWYFKNEKYDEELKARDQREDSNHYKFY